MADIAHVRARAGGMPSRFKPSAMVRGLLPAKYSAKIRRTMTAWLSSMARWPISVTR
ncbi:MULTISPECIES: hypothetical protein [unclassified Rhodanobacter]|uniref:hypothetical protein n=1 Tax=unclassified Rhodanobacter TaxID=2621553 RepID=UPI001BDE0573|nr:MULTISPECIES: hypothetical protein [unclassified Rhodanobacter]MBT2142743.1 hypothetical protein [Rhodanobacter sp. LX-99]MBT2148184.1 hypothetical protein [Rhodanobacter sp. LX-100]